MSGLFEAHSYDFSWYAVPVFFVGGANWVLGAATLWRERASRPSVTLLLMTFVIGVWLLGLGGAYSARDADVGDAWVRISMTGTVFVPVGAFLHAALGTSRLQVMRICAAAGAVFSAFLAVAVWSNDALIEEVRHYFWGYYPVYGALGPVLIVYYGLFFLAGGGLYRMGHQTAKSATQRKRMRIRLAAVVMAAPATIDFLPTLGHGVYPFGYAFILGYIMLSTYTIWRYRLVDITPALAATQVIRTMTEGLLVVDRDGIVRVANEAAARIWGVRRGVVGVSVEELDARWGSGALSGLQDPDLVDHVEVTFRAADEEERTVILSASRLQDHLGEWVGTVYMLHDITERWRAEAALRQSEERFRSLVQHATDMITVVDADATVRYQSPAIQQVLGYEPQETLGKKLTDVVHPEDAAQFAGTLEKLTARTGGMISGQGRVRDAGGAWRHLEFTGTDQRHNPAIGGLVLNVRDITERIELEEQLRYQALHDPLTKLANRTRFTDRLELALARAIRSKRPVAVLFMDLDNFKGVNDSLGHSAGDLLLVEVAERVKACLRPADTMARLGGDEFAVLIEDTADAGEVTAVAERLLAALQVPFVIDGNELPVRASIGVSVWDGDAARNVDGILRDADVAMYAAKSQGKSCYRVWEPAMQTSMLERIELLADLPGATERGEFVLQYQPIFLLRSGHLFGVEALVRWQHPRRGLLPPGQFIALAEESGAILALGNWVLGEACRQAAAWQARFPVGGCWSISVNVSVKQLQSASFVRDVKRALVESGLEPRRLILEITESVMMHEVAPMLERLRELKGIGVGLALDDFGTGYSSLSYLRQFPFDLLKIDKSFIDDIGNDEERKELAHAIIELGKTLHLELVAEGIERGEQVARLQSIDCDLGQGFYFARPMDSDGVERLLAAADAAERTGETGAAEETEAA